MCSEVQPSLHEGFSTSKQSFSSCEVSGRGSKWFPTGENPMISGKEDLERASGSWDTEH